MARSRRAAVADGEAGELEGVAGGLDALVRGFDHGAIFLVEGLGAEGDQSIGVILILDQ